MLYSNINEIVYLFGLIMLFDKWHYCQLSWYFRETNITRVFCVNFMILWLNKHHEGCYWFLLGTGGVNFFIRCRYCAFFIMIFKHCKCVIILINNQTTQKSLSLSVNLIVTNKYYLHCMSLSLRLLFKHNCHCLSTWQT